MKSLSKLSVGEYQQLYSIQKSKDDDIDKAIASVSIITGKPRWEVEDIPLIQFAEISRSVAALFTTPLAPQKPQDYILISGQKYRVILDPKHLTAGQYIDLQHFLKGDIIDNLHKLMACIVIPAKGKYDGENHEKISQAIQDCNFIEVHATCVFFSTLWTNSIKAISPYLIREMSKMDPKLKEIDLESIMDGFSMLA